MILVAAVLLAIGMIAGAYLLAQGDYAPTVNVENPPSNVYVSGNPPEHMLSVSASASKEVAPDLLQIQVRVQTSAKNAKQSQEDNADVTAELRASLEAAGLSEEDMKTVSYSVQPEYNSFEKCDSYGCRWDSEVVGYKTVHTLMLSVKQLDKGGEYIDVAAGAGENQTFVDYVSFTLQDDTRRDVEKELLAEASEEAKDKAQNIAGGLGVSLGKPLSVSESYYYPYYNSYKTYGAYDYAEVSAAPTVLSPGDVEVSVTVNVGFEIGG
jgi:hypothetical protein